MSQRADNHRECEREVTRAEQNQNLVNSCFSAEHIEGGRHGGEGLVIEHSTRKRYYPADLSVGGTEKKRIILESEDGIQPTVSVDAG